MSVPDEAPPTAATNEGVPAARGRAGRRSFQLPAAAPQAAVDTTTREEVALSPEAPPASDDESPPPPAPVSAPAQARPTSTPPPIIGVTREHEATPSEGIIHDDRRRSVNAARNVSPTAEHRALVFGSVPNSAAIQSARTLPPVSEERSTAAPQAVVAGSSPDVPAPPTAQGATDFRTWVGQYVQQTRTPAPAPAQQPEPIDVDLFYQAPTATQGPQHTIPTNPFPIPPPPATPRIAAQDPDVGDVPDLEMSVAPPPPLPVFQAAALPAAHAVPATPASVLAGPDFAPSLVRPPLPSASQRANNARIHPVFANSGIALEAFGPTTPVDGLDYQELLAGMTNTQRVFFDNRGGGKLIIGVFAVNGRPVHEFAIADVAASLAVLARRACPGSAAKATYIYRSADNTGPRPLPGIVIGYDFQPIEIAGWTTGRGLILGGPHGMVCVVYKVPEPPSPFVMLIGDLHTDDEQAITDMVKEGAMESADLLEVAQRVTPLGVDPVATLRRVVSRITIEMQAPDPPPPGSNSIPTPFWRAYARVEDIFDDPDDIEDCFRAIRGIRLELPGVGLGRLIRFNCKICRAKSHSQARCPLRRAPSWPNTFAPPAPHHPPPAPPPPPPPPRYMQRGNQLNGPGDRQTASGSQQHAQQQQQGRLPPPLGTQPARRAQNSGRRA